MALSPETRRHGQRFIRGNEVFGVGVFYYDVHLSTKALTSWGEV